ncbi:MAG: anhydro-N-acetylmuramic acid kinase [Pseudomonadota bacterium]
MNQRFIGLMSGTSMDGIDAALVSFSDDGIELLATHEHAYEESLREQLAIATHNTSLQRADQVAELHAAVGNAFRDATNTLLHSTETEPQEVVAIGSHGQTLRHEPDADEPYSLQIGDAQLIADGTGITTVADFRSADIEAGGQGAPLAPAFHEWLFGRTNDHAIILNIGGIANVTVLRSDTPTTGFDTGPGNTLMDNWIRNQREETFDRDGEWAASGSVNKPLLERLLTDAYFARNAPKSTGFEYFNLGWLQSADLTAIAPQDVQATLCELTAATAAYEIQTADARNVYVCGGGAHNRELMRRLRARLPNINVDTTAAVGLDPNWVEAVAFAWLAMRRLAGLPGNLPSVTGADRPVLLGDIYEPSF